MTRQGVLQAALDAGIPAAKRDPSRDEKDDHREPEPMIAEKRQTHPHTQEIDRERDQHAIAHCRGAGCTKKVSPWAKPRCERLKLA